MKKRMLLRRFEERLTARFVCFLNSNSEMRRKEYETI